MAKKDDRLQYWTWFLFLSNTILYFQLKADYRRNPIVSTHDREILKENIDIIMKLVYDLNYTNQETNYGQPHLR